VIRVRQVGNGHQQNVKSFNGSSVSPIGEIEPIR